MVSNYPVSFRFDIELNDVWTELEIELTGDFSDPGHYPTFSFEGASRFDFVEDESGEEVEVETNLTEAQLTALFGGEAALEAQLNELWDDECGGPQDPCTDHWMV